MDLSGAKGRSGFLVSAALAAGVILGLVLATLASKGGSAAGLSGVGGGVVTLRGDHLLMAKDEPNIKLDLERLARVLGPLSTGEMRHQEMQEDQNYRGRPVVKELRSFPVARAIPEAVLVDRADYDDAAQPHFLPIPALRAPYRYLAWQGHATNHVIKWNLQRFGGFESVEMSDIGDCDHVLFRVPLYHSSKRTWHKGTGPCVDGHDPLRHITAHLSNLHEIDDKALVLSTLSAGFRAPMDVGGSQLALDDFLPRSFFMGDPDQCRAFWRAQQADRTVPWVKKSTRQASGRGIEFIEGGQFSRLLSFLGGSSCDKVKASPDGPQQAASKQHSFVMQQYLHPYLIEGRKFDVRAFAYVARLDPLLVYFHAGPLRLCVERHHPLSLATRPHAHVCNLGTAKRHPKWQREVFPDDSIRTFAHLKADIDKRFPGRYAGILEQMKRVMAGVLRATAPKLGGLPGQFELMAFDFMLDRDLKLWFIEVQPTPGAHFEGVKPLWGSIIDQQLEMLHHRRIGMPEYPPASQHTFDPVPIIDDWKAGPPPSVAAQPAPDASSSFAAGADADSSFVDAGHSRP